MAEISEDGIKKLIAKYKKSYIDNPDFLLSGYRQENQTVADYEGRQLLELMQNADDAKSEIIYISLDIDLHKLTVSNKGEPFSLGGVKSLMFPGLTTKNRVEFIGNKGLGFRSILNWVDSVEVKTQNISFRFSKNYVHQFYMDYLEIYPSVKDFIKEEVDSKTLAEDEIPIATLAFPELLTDLETEYTTSIILQFKPEELDSIEKQIGQIQEETLLFLPNIREIIVLKDGETTKSFKKEVDEQDLIRINNKTWNIYRKNDQFYSEKLKFNYAIVWQDEGLENGYFYNYFPTDVETHLPCIIHATFDLTNNRKEINSNDANKYILQQIAESLGKIVSKKIKKELSDWTAFKFLTAELGKKREVLSGFYNSLNQFKEEFEVYPTVDNKYVTKEKAIYHGVAFSHWVALNGFGLYFPNLLKVPDQDIYLPEFAFKKYSGSELVGICKRISFQIKDHTCRAELIKLFTQENFQNLHSSSEYLPLLISSDYKYEDNSYDETVFALNIANRNFVFPEEFKISFIEPSFYKVLGSIFENEIENTREKDEDRSRTLKKILKNVVDLGSNDITDVVRFVVSQTNNIINESVTENKGIVLKMVKSLFSVFDPEKNAGNKTAVNNIPLLNRNSVIKRSDELFFGNDYLVDINTEDIFNGIYTADHYLLSAKEMGLDDMEDNAVLSFFEWIGVNRLISISKYEDLTGNDLHGYFDFLFDQRRLIKPDQATKYNSSLKAIKINNIDAVGKLALNELIILLEKSSELKREINLGLENNSAKVFFKYGNAYAKQIIVPYSFIYFQISKLIDFSEYTVSEDAEFQIMFKRIDLNDSFFTDKLDKNQLDSLKHTLKYLGTSESISDISEDRIKYLLRNQQIKFPDGNNSQSFYKKCLEFFLQKHLDNNIKDKEIFNLSAEYFSRKGIDSNAIELIEKEKVFYSDNLLLPRKILENFYFINLPRRIGEENVKRIFEVKLIKDELSKIHLGKEEPNEILTLDLNNYLEKLKPYFLTYRLEQIKLAKKAEAQLIKPLRLKVVTDLSYQFDGGEVNVLEKNEFLPHKDCFYIKTNKIDLNSVKSDADFCDLIAEIVGMTFKVATSKNIFRRIFKDGVKDSYHIIKSDGKESVFEEAKKLLGISDAEKIFWSKILQKDFTFLDDADLLKEEIKRSVQIDFPDYYPKIDFSTLGDNHGVSFLNWLSEIINFDLKTVITESTLENWHRTAIENCINNETNKFEKLLWKKASESPLEEDRESFFERLMAFDSVPIDSLKIFTTENAFNLHPDYSATLRKWTLERFEIDLNQEVSQRFDVCTKYRDIIENFEFGNSVEDMEKIIKNDNFKLYSLMYFDNYGEEIKDECIRQQKEFEAEISKTNLDDSDEDILNVYESYISFAQSNSAKSANVNNKGGSYNSKSDRKKATSGKIGEDRVKKALLRKGYQINDVSSKTDGKHYDLAYLEIGQTEWRLLEVKKDSGGFFFLSKWEKETALSSLYSEKYDVALVDEKSIHIIKSPFHFVDDSFEDNSLFHSEPTEYKISFKLNGIKE
ncbi:hypothetical protein SAMN05421789_11056 [Kaistella chaponensis]|uniref:Protein NO VEIN C-terminal domain-containing protein n=1 Tax=Kaistella chaponensis TaxID=713588 RepID=A0A1N7MUS0_9FLAO|nr:hypothetical protein [Kaistella chaponensis]SIS89802.1 hypothetical protein SAMN05421789_11056 [Kaistella chaponensis]